MDKEEDKDIKKEDKKEENKELNSKSQLLNKASENALSIENSISSFATKSLGNTEKVDLLIEELIYSIEENLPEMNPNEKLNALRTLSTIRNSQASTVLNAINSDSNGNTLLDKLRDRELTNEDVYEETFQSVKNKPDLSLGLANLNKLMEMLGDTDKKDNK